MADITINALPLATLLPTSEFEIQATAGGASGKVVGLAGLGIANTFTALQMITQASANAGILASTGYSLTGSDATSMVSLAGAWNTSGNPVAMKIAITDTASGATSKLMSLLAGAAGTTEVAYVKKDGTFYAGALSYSADVIHYFNSAVGALAPNTNSGYIWSQGIRFYNSSTGDATMIEPAAGVVTIKSSLNTSTYANVYVNNLRSYGGASGQYINIASLTELTTIAAAATTDTTIQMPAGAIVLAVSTRVTTVIPTATSFSVGDSGSATRFSTTGTINVAAGTTDAGTLAGAYYNASALSIRLTMNGGTPAANTGRVRVTIFYILSTPPTS